MRVSRVIFWFVFCLSLPGQISSLFGQSVTSLIHDVSSVADGSVTQARLEAQRQAMGAGPAYRSYEKDDFRTFSGRYTPPELPEDKKGRFVYGLALFSDDGCNVTADSSPIHQRLGQAQHLPDIGASFQVLQTVLAPGEPIDITVNYSNIIYNDDPDSPDYPDIDGCTLFLYLIPAAIAVDANRDGTIAFSGEARDTTSQDAPFRFWINNDNDGLFDFEQEVMDGVPDYQDQIIQNRRDLEDFTRLHIHIGALQDAIVSEQIKVGLKWKNITGTPAINIYKAADPNGSDEYLRDEGAAQDQVSDEHTSALAVVGGSNAVILPAHFWQGLSKENSAKYLILEAAGEGKGRLLLTFHKSDGSEIGEGGEVWLDLLNIKKMYVRAMGTPVNDIDAPWDDNPNLATSFVFDPNGNNFVAPPDEEKTVIIYVHGIHAPFAGENASYLGNIGVAETVFKRLWHVGYKGRLAFFKWPALNPAGFFFNGTGFEFNQGEYRGWKYGKGLSEFAASMPSDYQRHVLAHSQGNALVAAAFRNYNLSAATWVITQGAIPISCYDDNTAHLVFEYTTPDLDANLGYRGYLKDQIPAKDSQLLQFGRQCHWPGVGSESFLLQTHY